ncbi:isoaspartyl peptidase/L-asparaginase family protein [Parvularcula oceani]|uniref:isoaspartyl peptidase/L-asparaginase family protein n=1 Tax=Parvularcula oceani TaxID=1247963 RepID=UPI00068A5FAA|nr:isoaspartyl peptidase/L-asparaginase [Parvularcula oceani]
MGLSALAASLLLAAQGTAAADAPASCAAQEDYAIIVHGGTARAGQVPEERLTFIRSMLGEMREDLREGSHAVDVAQEAIRRMEASGLFNAGRASITNAEGFVENDASIMDGRTFEAGAIASMTGLKSPITAARLVMDETRHVMMVGDRGEEAVLERGAEPAPEGWFLRARGHDEPEEHGTVGAAVLDRCGDLAAGTSTGGYDAKIPGRVGDSPVIGAGTFAKNGVMAASATGHGEYFVRFGATRSIAARMEYGGQGLEEAAEAVIAEMQAAGDGRSGRGGIVAVDAEGNFATPFSSEGMVRGYASDEEAPVAGAFGSVD